MSALIAVRVLPRSARDAIEGVGASGELRVRVTAPPADGAANAALVKLVARTLGIPTGAVIVVSGRTSRHKRLSIEDMPVASLEERWPGVRATRA